MLAIKKIRKLIEKSPESDEAQFLSALVLALESDDNEFRLSGLYNLPLQHFDLALELLREWRIDGHYRSKGKLLDAISALDEK
ncbi:MAG: hypothetical protein QM617_10375 [Comamonas sp.]